MTLSQPLSLVQPALDTFDEKINFVIENFKGIFLNRDNRPSFGGQEIYFEMSREVRGMLHPYPEKLMHILSLEGKNEVEILPCNNDEASMICANQCNFRMANRDFHFIQRQDCFYRMSRVHWIPEIINLANSGSLDIKIWVEEERNKRGKKIKKTFLRYQKGLTDYVIILTHRYRDGKFLNYIFETAFPVFYQRTKKQFDKNYMDNT
ncbi:hypothetical protein [Viridibacillus arvi]|uniref:hypothetical protein n=1 Tax=Viridibacillus arvi TaxID=263475 RepID=UPI0036E90CB0